MLSRLQSPRRLFERQMNRNLNRALPWSSLLRAIHREPWLSPFTTATARAEAIAAGWREEWGSMRVPRPAGMDSLLVQGFVWAEETSYVKTEGSDRTSGSTSFSGTTPPDAPGGTNSARESR